MDSEPATHALGRTPLLLLITLLGLRRPLLHQALRGLLLGLFLALVAFTHGLSSCGTGAAVAADL